MRMGSLLLAVIYLVFISLGLPDSLLGSGWPTMQAAFGVPSSYAGYVSMTICFMTILSALVSPRMIRKYHTKWIVLVSIALTVLGLLGFSVSSRFWMLFLFAVPFGLGAGSIDAAVNHYVASHYPASVMNFLIMSFLSRSSSFRDLTTAFLPSTVSSTRKMRPYPPVAISFMRL